jgi:hypothetical protein
MSKRQIVKLIRGRLSNYHPGGVTLEVVDEEIWREDDYWHVPVRPSAQPPRTFEYYDALVEVETELSLKEHLEMLLVPMLPEQDQEPAPNRR